MTDPINFRALCVNLLDCLEKADWPPRYRNVFGQWVYIARKALTETADGPAVPEGREPPAVAERPSDDELGLIYHDCCGGCEFMDQGGFEDAARAVLARWGQPPAPSAEGEAAELTRSDVLHWLQQDRSWGVLIAPIEWRAVDEEWLDLIHRAVMAHRVSPNRGRYKPPAPPAGGEVAKLVAWLREEADDWSQANPRGYQGERLARAADLLERHAAPVPVPVAEGLPGPVDCAPWPGDPNPSHWCWVGRDVDGGWEWEQRSADCLLVFDEDWWTYWLPAHALPLPAPQGGEVEL